MQAAARYDWHTVCGTREDAKALERKYENAKKNDEYIGRPERKTFEEVANLFLDDRRAKNRRVSTLEEYQTELKLRLLPQPNEKLPPLGPRNIRNIQRADMKVHFNSLRNRGRTISQVNKAIKAAKAIFAIATPFELGLFGTLSISGPRPGEIYALEWPEVYLDVEKPYFRIVRTWCSKGFRFYTPKTEAGRRTVPISAWLAAVLREQLVRRWARLCTGRSQRERCGACRIDATHPTRAPRASQWTSPAAAAARHRRRAARRQ